MRTDDFERAVLGAVLLNPEHWSQIAELHPEDFSLDSHRKIFSRMLELAESSRPIDTVTLVNELERRKELQAIGDVGYVSSLVDGLPDRPLESVKHYIDEVLRGAGLRHITHAADSIRERAANDPAASITDLRRRLSETGRATARFEAKRGPCINRIEDIPDPFACASEQIEWVVYNLIPARGITMIAGEPGAGKTWLALSLARSLTFGDDFLGRRTQTAKVLYIDRENPLSLIRDRLQVLFGGSSEFRPWGLWCPDEPPLIGDPRLLEFAQQAPVLIIDSMIRFHKADENSATQMAPVMASLRQLATLGASIVILHHKSKSETSSYRGSSDIVAGADAVFALAKRDVLLELWTIKNRFASDTTIKIRADFEAGTFVVTDSPGPDRSSEVDRLADIIRTSPGLTQNDVVKRSGMNRKHAIELLRSHGDSVWRRTPGANRSLSYYPIQAVPNDARHESIRNQSHGGSYSSLTADSSWREPVGITKVVPVLPPFRGGNREQLTYHGA
jgi:hypothetical protein